jgi:hypothetical protein
MPRIKRAGWFKKRANPSAMIERKESKKKMRLGDVRPIIDSIKILRSADEAALG